jgi:hypothetical protein
MSESVLEWIGAMIFMPAAVPVIVCAVWDLLT